VARMPPPKARMIGARYAIGLKAERSRMVETPLDFVASRCALLPRRQTAGPGRRGDDCLSPRASRRIATPDLGLGWIPEPAAASGTRKFRDCCCPNVPMNRSPRLAGLLVVFITGKYLNYTVWFIYQGSIT
jgi:hypothetical protein